MIQDQSNELKLFKVKEKNYGYFIFSSYIYIQNKYSSYTTFNCL